jgi:uroporphyrinogen decarboxylase
MTAFVNNYHHMLDVLANRRPARLPIYEHIISPLVMERVLNVPFADLQQGEGADLDEFFRHYCRFWQEMTYDTVSFEVTITDLLPGHGAILGGRPGPIQNRSDFEKYPWADLAGIYWQNADRQFKALHRHLPEGMKALGGVGNGLLEISEDLVGFQYLAYLQADDPDLFAALYVKIGDLMVDLWTEFLKRYGDDFAICRFGDDLGFRSGTLVAPKVIRQHIIPQYKRVIDLIKGAGKPFLWHSCGKIFAIMDDVIALGIDAKHSNEDAIAAYDEWIARYSERIGLLGGVDVDILCQQQPEDVVKEVMARGTRFRAAARGYGLGSGNSIPDYVPVEGYLAMIEAAQKIRTSEQLS